MSDFTEQPASFADVFLHTRSEEARTIWHQFWHQVAAPVAGAFSDGALRRGPVHFVYSPCYAREGQEPDRVPGCARAPWNRFRNGQPEAPGRFSERRARVPFAGTVCGFRELRARGQEPDGVPVAHGPQTDLARRPTGRRSMSERLPPGTGGLCSASRSPWVLF